MMLLKAPLVSIIMPCYNAERHLPAAINSVREQTFGHWELIAVDDGSQDATLAWLQRQTDPRVLVHAQTNKGVSVARNAGIQLARGRYLAFLDCDDTWAPNFLKRLTDTLERSPEAVLAYCGWQNLGLPGPRSQPFVPPDYENPNKRETLFDGCRWPIHAALVRREAVLQAGGFDARLRNAEDYALWLELAGNAPIVRVTEILAFYHFHGDAQATSNRCRAALHHLMAQQEYLRRYPDFARQLGRKRIRASVYGGLKRKAYEAYWGRDLLAARALFRRVLRAGYVERKDWLYMLPSFLPLSWHQRLIDVVERGRTRARA